MYPDFLHKTNEEISLDLQKKLQNGAKLQSSEICKINNTLSMF